MCQTFRRIGPNNCYMYMYIYMYTHTYIYTYIYVYGKYIYYRPAMLRATLSKFQLNERVNK